MTKLLMCIPAALLLAGCSSEGQKAEERFEMVKRNSAGAQQSCDEAERVAQAYLNEGNERKYKDWQATATVECSAARLDALND